jgi:hypothetical protein
MRTTIASMGRAAVAFGTSHRTLGELGGTDPVLVTMSAPIELSFDDLVAALFVWEPHSRADIVDDRTARELIAEAVFNRGCNSLVTAREDVLAAEATALPGDVMWEWIEFCRQRVTDLFGTAVPTPRSCTSRPRLASVPALVDESVRVVG